MSDPLALLATACLALAAGEESPRDATARAMRACAEDLAASLAAAERTPGREHIESALRSIEGRFRDGWGNGLEARLLVILISFGADGLRGGKGADEDSEFRVVLCDFEGAWPENELPIVFQNQADEDTQWIDYIMYLGPGPRKQTRRHAETILRSIKDHVASRGVVPRSVEDVHPERLHPAPETKWERDLRTGKFQMLGDDGWQRPFRIAYAVTIRSRGADGAVDGIAENADVFGTYCVREIDWDGSSEVRELEAPDARRTLDCEIEVSREKAFDISLWLARDGIGLLRADRVSWDGGLARTVVSCRFYRVPPGELDVCLAMLENESGESLLPLGRIAIADGVDFRLQYRVALGRVAGELVVEGDGSLPPNATVELRLEDRSDVTPIRARVGRTGRFLFPLVPEGLHALSLASDATGPVSSTTVRVTANRTAGVELTLPH